MNKYIKLIYLFLLLFLSNCSFDNKSGIWDGIDEIKRVAELELQQSKGSIIQIYSSKNSNLKEIPSNGIIKLNNSRKNDFWIMPGLNLQNNLGNIYLPSIENNFLKKKIGKNKFDISVIKSAPLIFKDNVIISDDTGSIFSVTQKGKINWKINIYKKIYKKIYKNLTFSVYKDKIYIADNIGFIYSIDVNNGNLNWVKNHAIPLKSKIKIFNDKIFIINQDNRLICLDVNNGTILWDIRSINSFIKAQNHLSLSISKAGNIIMLGSSGDLLKINSVNGQVYWSINVAGTSSFSSDFFKSSEIVIGDNDVIFSTTDAVFSFNLNTGYLNWSNYINSINTPVIDGKHIFLISEDGFFVNIDKNNGKIIWSTNILKILKKRKQKTIITGFILGSEKIYATTLNGFLIVSSATSGKTEYFTKIGDSLTSSPIISNGSLYILTAKSRIFGFN